MVSSEWRVFLWALSCLLSQPPLNPEVLNIFALMCATLCPPPLLFFFFFFCPLLRAQRPLWKPEAVAKVKPCNPVNIPTKRKNDWIVYIFSQKLTLMLTCWCFSWMCVSVDPSVWWWLVTPTLVQLFWTWSTPSPRTWAWWSVVTYARWANTSFISVLLLSVMVLKML